MKYQRLRDLQRTMGGIVERDELAAALFAEVPELEEFTWVKSQEYDDNNYFDNIQVKSINGHPYGYDGYDDDEADDEKSSLPKVEQVHLIEDLIVAISDHYDFSDDEIEFRRGDYLDVTPGEKSDYERDKKQYFLSMLSGSRLPDEFFAGKDPQLAIYHAIDHGRIGNEAEVFAVRGNMSQVLDYARVVGGRVSDEVEKFFILDSHEDDKESLKQYIEEFGKK